MKSLESTIQKQKEDIKRMENETKITLKELNQKVSALKKENDQLQKNNKTNEKKIAYLESELDTIKKEKSNEPSPDMVPVKKKDNKKAKHNQEEAAVDIPMSKSLRCDQCIFDGINENDLEKNKCMHSKQHENTQTLQPDTWLGRCGICKFCTTDRAHYKRHMETFVHKTKVY